MDPAHASPREPEIEFLGRVVAVFLASLRVALSLAGLFAVAFGLYDLVSDWQQAEAPGDPPATRPGLTGVVWICAGLPLVLPVDWLFGRGRWLALGIGLILWFGPLLLAGDRDYVWALRVFATFVACASLLVWRTLWKLTRH